MYRHVCQNLHLSTLLTGNNTEPTLTQLHSPKLLKTCRAETIATLRKQAEVESVRSSESVSLQPLSLSLSLSLCLPPSSLSLSRSLLMRHPPTPPPLRLGSCAFFVKGSDAGHGQRHWQARGGGGGGRRIFNRVIELEYVAFLRCESVLQSQPQNGFRGTTLERRLARSLPGLEPSLAVARGSHSNLKCPKFWSTLVCCRSCNN